MAAFKQAPDVCTWLGPIRSFLARSKRTRLRCPADDVDSIDQVSGSYNVRGKWPVLDLQKATEVLSQNPVIPNALGAGRATRNPA